MNHIEHKTYRDFMVMQEIQTGPNKLRNGRVLIWRCTDCGATGRWEKGWAYYGNIECRGCGLAAIERVLCSNCYPQAKR